MNIKLAKRIAHIKPSATLAIGAKAKELKAAGKDVIGLSLGEPDFETPEHIKQAGIKAIENGITRYTPVDGTPKLKQAIVNKFKKENQLDYQLDQIIVSTGAKQSLYNALQVLIDPGDEVIILAPYWVSYPDMIYLAEGKPVTINTSNEQNLKVIPEQLIKAITPKTRALIINSPSNPSGMIYTKTELAALGEVLQNHPQIIIISDDIYEHIAWTNAPFSNIVNASPSLYEQTVVINGGSKVFAMTGWRMGYAAGPKEIILAMKKVQSQSTSNPNSIAQEAMLAALKNNQKEYLKEMVQAFKGRHDFVCQSLNKIRGFECLPAQGTFYAFPNVQNAINKLGLANDLALTEFLLDKAEVAVVPGSEFGSPGFIRISYAASMETLKEAMSRIAKICNI